jgi:CheY-like chemotaxis protein
LRRIRRRILIVEDDADARVLLAAYLGGATYEVETAADGNEGIALALRSRPCLIVLDLSMPRLDGWSTARLLRAYPATTAIPLVAWSGLGHEAATTALAAGFDAVIAKPCLPKDVERVIDQLLQGDDGQSSEAG